MVLVACDLPHAVRIASNLLGTSQVTAIDGVETQVHWPAVRIGPLDWPELIAPDVLKVVASPESWPPPPFMQWGVPTHLTASHEILTAEVTRIVLVPSLKMSAELPTDRHDAIRPVIEWLAPRLYSWLSLVIEWLEVQTQQVGAPAARHRPEGTIFDGVHMWRRHGSDWTEPYKWGWSPGLQFTLDKPEWGVNAGLEEVELALRNASERREPHPAYQFMRSAKAALMEARARRAVLDIGLAAELLLLPIFDNSKQQKPSSKNPDRERTPTLGTIVATLESMSIALPERLRERVVEPRNDAAHRGDIVTLDSAWDAYRATLELLGSFAPPLHD